MSRLILIHIERLFQEQVHVELLKIDCVCQEDEVVSKSWER